MAVLTVALDIDGVLANYNAGMASIARGLYGIELPVHPGDIPEYCHYSKVLGKERFAVVWDMATRNPHFLVDLPPLASPQEFAMIESLNLIANVYFVTRRLAFGSKTITEQWLIHHGISAPTVILSGDKGLIAKAVNANFILEDSADNVLSVRTQSPETQAYLMRYPYNTWAVKAATKCVTSVGEFYRDVIAA